MSKDNGYILQIPFYCHAIFQYVEADPRKFQNKTTQGTQSYYDKQSKCLHGKLPGFEQSQWRQISVMATQIIANSTVCSIAFQARNKEKNKAPYYRLFVRGILPNPQRVIIYNQNKTKRTTIACPLQWHHNEHDDGSNHQPHDCLLNCLFRRRPNNT